MHRIRVGGGARTFHTLSSCTTLPAPPLFTNLETHQISIFKSLNSSPLITCLSSDQLPIEAVKGPYSKSPY